MNKYGLRQVGTYERKIFKKIESFIVDFTIKITIMERTKRGCNTYEVNIFTIDNTQGIIHVKNATLAKFTLKEAAIFYAEKYYERIMNDESEDLHRI